MIFVARHFTKYIFLQLLNKKISFIFVTEMNYNTHL